MLYLFFNCGECDDNDCLLSKLIRHNGSATRSKYCRFHKCAATKVDTIHESEASPRKFLIESNNSLDQLLKLEAVSKYFIDPLSQQGLVGRNMFCNMTLAKAAIETTLIQTEITNHMGNEKEDKDSSCERKLFLNRIVLSFSQLVGQPPSIEATIPRKNKPKNSNEKLQRDSTGVQLLLTYYFGPFLLSLFMETIGLNRFFRSHNKIIGILMRLVTSSRDSYKFAFAEHAAMKPILDEYAKQLKFGEKKKKKKKVGLQNDGEKKKVKKKGDPVLGWRDNTMKKLSVVVWATRFIIDSILACGAFGVSDALVNLLSIESNSNHGDEYSNAKDCEYLQTFAALSYLASLKTRAVVIEATKESIGKQAPALFTDSKIGNISGIYLATLMSTQMSIMKLLFRHGILGKPNLSNAVVEQYPSFSEIILNRNCGNEDFKNKVIDFVVVLVKGIPGLNRFHDNVGEIIVDLVLNASSSIRTMPFFYVNCIGSYIKFAMPQVKHVYHSASLILNTSNQPNQVDIADRRGRRKNIERSADRFSDFHLERSDFAVYPCDSSNHIFATWDCHKCIAVTPVSDANAYAFSFHFGRDIQLIRCLPPKLRLEQMLIHAKCILREQSLYPYLWCDTTQLLGVSCSDAEVLRETYELIRRARSSWNQTLQDTSYTVLGGNTSISHDHAVEVMQLTTEDTEPIPESFNAEQADFVALWWSGTSVADEEMTLAKEHTNHADVAELDATKLNSQSVAIEEMVLAKEHTNPIPDTANAVVAESDAKWDTKSESICCVTDIDAIAPEPFLAEKDEEEFMFQVQQMLEDDDKKRESVADDQSVNSAEEVRQLLQSNEEFLAMRSAKFLGES